MSNATRTDQFVDALRASGSRITPQRIEVCRALAQSREHPTAQAIYEQVSARFPGISQATVYNTLTVLRDLGEIVEVGVGRDRTHYEPDPTPHVNLICLRCGTVQDVEDERVGELSEALAERHNLKLKTASLALYGFCEACREH